MRASMSQLTPRFSSNRAVCEYTERFYLPAADAYRTRAANGGAAGRGIVDWQHQLNEIWHAVQFGAIKSERRGNEHFFEVHVQLDGLDPDTVCVELYADGVGGAAPLHQPMRRVGDVSGAPGSYFYAASVSATRPPSQYTPRIVPYRAGVAVPLEAIQIRWPG